MALFSSCKVKPLYICPEFKSESIFKSLLLLAIPLPAIILSRILGLFEPVSP